MTLHRKGHNMHTTLPQPPLATALTWLAANTPTRPYNPTETTLKVTTTNGTLTLATALLSGHLLHAETELPATVGETLNTRVPTRALAEIVKRLPKTSEVSLSLPTPNQLRVAAGRAVFTLATVTAEDAPPPEPPPLISTIDADHLKWLTQTAGTFCADDGDTRPILAAIHIEPAPERLTFAATNRYRLTELSAPWEHTTADAAPVNVNGKALTAILKGFPGGDLEIRASPDLLTVRGATQRITIRTIDGAFPNYRNLFPPHGGDRITFNTETFTAAARLVRAAAEGFAPVKLTIDTDALTPLLRISTLKNAPVTGADAIDVQTTNTTETNYPIGVNPEYLEETLTCVPTTNAVAQIDSPTKPIVFTPEWAEGDDDKGTTFRAMLMPMKLTNDPT